MNKGLYDHGYGETWKDVYVYRKEGFTTSVADYHAHGFYEINLIFSGNVKILLPGHSLETSRQHLILTAPGTPHYISCNRDTLYSRLYLSFSPEFLDNTIPEAQSLLEIFGKAGRIVPLSRSRTELCKELIERIEGEDSPLRRRLLILYLLSSILSFAEREDVVTTPVPSYVIEALSYIEKHYPEKILANDLAKRLHIGRTTLMTSFKKYMGTGLSSYLIRYRLKMAREMLRQGVSVQETAERCGFGDSGSLIRSFKKHFGTTPGRFLPDEE